MAATQDTVSFTDFEGSVFEGYSDSTTWLTSVEVLNAVSTNFTKSPNIVSNFLYGSPTVLLDNTTSAMLNDNNRFFYFDKLRSHFSAGRHNNLADVVPQWRVEKLAQYSASFGWDQFLYGGHGTTNGDKTKGQFSSGYQNRGFAPYAQTQGFQNINGGTTTIVEGSENYVGGTLYDATYNIGTGEFTIVGVDLTAVFLVNRYMGIRVYNAANSYYTQATGEILSVTYSAGNTVIIGAHTNWTDFAFASCQIFNLEHNSNSKANFVAGNGNKMENVEHVNVIGKNNILQGRQNVTLIGDNLKAEFDASQIHGTEKYTENGDCQTIFCYPKLVDIGSNIKRFSYDNGNTTIPIPLNSSWYVKVTAVFKNTSTNATYSVDGSVLLHRGSSGAATIDSQTITDSGGYGLVAYGFSSGTQFGIQFTTADSLRGSAEIKIIQVK